MVARLVYTSDTHFKSRRPLRRTDVDFFAAQMKKLDEIVAYCIDNKVKAFLHAGDMWDVALPEYGILNSVAERYQKLYKAGIDCYITPGSHDLLGYRIDSLSKTGIGTLIHTGLLKTLIGPQDVHGVSFYGVPALLHHTVEPYKKIPTNYIIITHNIVTSDPVNFEHLTFKDLSFSEAGRVFLCAHYHKFFKMQVGNNYFFSTGPLIRGDKNEHDHTPNILVLDISAAGLVFNSKFINCDQNIMDLTDKTELGSNCISGLRDTRINFFDLFDLTKQIAQAHNVPTPVLDNALIRLESAQRSLLDG